MEFKLRERPNLDNLNKVLRSPYILKNDIQGYYAYYQAAKGSLGTEDGIDMVYRQRLYNGVPYGRYYPDCGSMKACAYQWRAVRSYLFRDSEVDIDIVNCHPTILLEICNENTIGAPSLAGYVQSRREYLDDLNISDSDVHNYNVVNFDEKTKADLGKLVFNMLLYGSGDPNIKSLLNIDHSPFKKTGKARELANEIRKLSKVITKLPKYERLVKDITAERKMKKKAVHAGSLLSFILQERERAAVTDAVKAFQERGLTVTAYIYDGFQVVRNGEIQSVLDQINKHSSLKFIMKPFSTPLSELTFPTTIRTDEEIKADDELYSSVNAAGFTTAKKSSNDGTVLIARNDHDAAKLFLKHYGNHFVKIDDSRCYTLNGNRWVAGSEPLLRLIFEAEIKKMNEDGDIVEYGENTRNAENIKKAVLAISEPDPDFVYKNNLIFKDHICFKNCIFNVKTMKFIDYKDFSKGKPIAIYNIDIEKTIYPLDNPRIVEIRSKILSAFGGVPEQEYVLKTLSRAITGHYEDKVFYIVNGPRNSGKGVFTHLIATGFGSEYVTETNIPIAKSSISTDIAFDRRYVLTLRHDTARIALGNEARSKDGKPVMLDGNEIKAVTASGGDKITTRVMHGNEVKAIVNAISFFCVNELPRCSPENAMVTSRILTTATTFGEIRDDDEFSGTLRKDDPDIKKWITETDWIPNAMLSMVYHYHSDTPLTEKDIPESFRQEREDLGLSEPKINDILKRYFQRVKPGEPSSSVPCDEVFELVEPLGFTKNKLTRTLATIGIKKKDKNSTEYTGLRRIETPKPPSNADLNKCQLPDEN